MNDALAVVFVSLMAVVLTVYAVSLVRGWRWHRRQRRSPDLVLSWRDESLLGSMKSRERKLVRRAVRRGEAVADPSLARMARLWAVRVVHRWENPWQGTLTVLTLGTCAPNLMFSFLPWLSRPASTIILALGVVCLLALLAFLADAHIRRPLWLANARLALDANRAPESS